MPVYPIIALWAHPRSMSTAVERLMRERGDLVCYHEPFLADYYLHRKLRKMPLLDDDNPLGFDQMRQRILATGENQAVFFKDMAYYVVPSIFNAPELIKRITHTFVIRDSFRSLVSYYKLDPELTCEEVGYNSQWQLYCHLRDQGIAKPVIICAEDIARDPKAMMEIYWHGLQLDYLEHAFSWQPEMPADWQRVAGWHRAVAQSTGIYEHEDSALAEWEFEQLVRTAPQLRDYLDAHRDAYDALRAHAVRPPD